MASADPGHTQGPPRSSGGLLAIRTYAAGAPAAARMERPRNACYVIAGYWMVATVSIGALSPQITAAISGERVRSRLQLRRVTP